MPDPAALRPEPDIRLVIFDCDGTLVDSEPVLASSLVAEFTALHPDVAATMRWTQDDFEGRPMPANIAMIAARAGVELPPDFEQRVRARMTAAYDAGVDPIPGAAELLQRLRVPCCVASNGPRPKIEQVLGRTGLLPAFGDRIYSAYEVGSFKPAPGLFLHAAAAHGLPVEACAVVEDSLSGLEAGLAAGMTVYAYRPAAKVPVSMAGRVKCLAQLTDLLLEPWHPAG